jgi:hypothetical protein
MAKYGTQINCHTSYVCERCGKAVVVSLRVVPPIILADVIDLEAIARVSECDSCLADKMELIRDLWLAVPAAKKEEFDNPILDELEMMIRGSQTVGYVGATL